MKKEDLKIDATYRDKVLKDEHFILREIDDHGVGLDTKIQFYNRLDGLVRFPMNVFLKGFEPVGL